MSSWAWWRRKSPASWLFTQPFIQAQIKKNQSSSSLAFVRGIHRWPVNSPHKGPVMRKMFPFDDVIMTLVFSIPDSMYSCWPVTWAGTWLPVRNAHKNPLPRNNMYLKIKETFCCWFSYIMVNMIKTYLSLSAKALENSRKTSLMMPWLHASWCHQWTWS